MSEQPTYNDSNNNPEEKENFLLRIWNALYGLTIIKDTDSLPLWLFKIFLRIIFIIILIALSPFILLGLFLTFLMAF